MNFPKRKDMCFLKRPKCHFHNRLTTYSILDKSKHGHICKSVSFTFLFLFWWCHWCSRVIASFLWPQSFWPLMLAFSDIPGTPAGFCIHLLHFTRTIPVLSIDYFLIWQRQTKLFLLLKAFLVRALDRKKVRSGKLAR